MLRSVKNEACDTIFYQGNGSSQTQVTKYTGGRETKATTSEFMWSDGKNGLKPLDVIYKPHLDPEIADVNLNPFNSRCSYFNPIKIIGYCISSGSAWLNGMRFKPALNPTSETVRFHAPNIAMVSIGQETDIESHRKKYQSWLNLKDRSKHLILWGVSRGTATTFCAMAKEKYPEVKLIVLEGAIDSVNNVITKRAINMFKYPVLAHAAECVVKSGLSLFTTYREKGPSPLTSVADFPKGIPVVFITSEIDSEVPCANTENIANTLAKRGENDVYLLRLKKSSHPNYMFDDHEDRDNYEAFIHAIYQRYNLQYNPELAEKGKAIIIKSKVNSNLSENKSNSIAFLTC